MRRKNERNSYSGFGNIASDINKNCLISIPSITMQKQIPTQGETNEFLGAGFLRSRKISSETEISDQVKLFFSDATGKVTIRFDVTGATQYYDLNRSEIEGLAKELLTFLDSNQAN